MFNGTILIPTKTVFISIKFSFVSPTDLRITTPGCEYFMTRGDTKIPEKLNNVLVEGWGCSAKAIQEAESKLLSVLEGQSPADTFYAIKREKAQQ